MEKLSKQFGVLVTKWRTNIMSDEFLIARVKLNLFYSAIIMVILGGASFILYKVLLSNILGILEENLVSPLAAEQILHRAQELLQARILIVDSIIMIFVVVLGFFLTNKTLKPIKINSQRQKQFIADAAHELRTPVAIAISGLEVALRNKKLDMSIVRTVMESSLNEMRELSKLSNNLLDIAKLDRHHKVVHEIVPITQLVRLVAIKTQLLAQEKSILINVDLKNEENVSGNAMDLERVFYNIINNAIAHTGEVGSIEVSDKVVGKNYSIVIKDNGVGMESEVLQRVFDPFFQGDISRNQSGAGLGLTLAKKIITEHLGTISIESQVGQGTAVTISLPTVSK